MQHLFVLDFLSVLTKMPTLTNYFKSNNTALRRVVLHAIVLLYPLIEASLALLMGILTLQP